MIEWARDGPISTEEESLSRLWSETYRLGLLWWVVIALVVEDVPDEQNVLSRDHSASRERVC
jgi:hypothetical protein